MPVDPEALRRFLERPLEELPQFKGADPAALDRIIYDCTGTPYQEITKSRPHQLEGVAFALYKRSALLFYWMRLGKTKLALDWAAHLKRSNILHGKGLIIAHAPIGADVWETEAAKHSAFDVRVIRSGATAAAARDAFIDALESDCDLVVAPHSILQSLFSISRLSRKKMPKLYPDLDALAIAAEHFTHCIIDETHLCGGQYSLRFAICAAITEHCKYSLGLTGTPVGRDPFVVWPQTYLVDRGRTLSASYGFFEAAFGKTKYSHFHRANKETVFDKSKLPILQAKLANLSLAYGEGEVKSAEVFAGTVELRMTTAQRAAYNDVIEHVIKVGVDEVIEIHNIFVRLRQIATGYLPFSDDEGEKRIVHFDGVKFAWLRELLADVPPSVQCVIFHEFVHTGELICKEMTSAKKTHSWLYGGTKDKPEARKAFQRGDVQFLVANTASGGTSIDLPMADYLCFFESPVSPRVRAQAQARPMARGDRPLMLDDLVCAPVERKILGFLREGKDMSEALIHGGRKLFASLRE